MLSRVITAALLSLFIQQIEGFQRVLVISEAQVQNTSSINDEGDRVTSLHGALTNLTSNVLINITTDVKLYYFAQLFGVANILLVGYNNPTVHCNGYGGILFTSCHNCTIERITWERCGARNISDNNSVLKFYNSSSVNIRNCSFQNSTGQALVLSAVSGNVNINQCNFLYNIQYQGHGAAVHYSSSNLHHSALSVTIDNCRFNGMNAKSVVYFGSPITKNSSIYLQNSSFQLNKGVPVYLSNQSLYIHGNIDFNGNTAGVLLMHRNRAKNIYAYQCNITFGDNATVTFHGGMEPSKGSGVHIKHYSIVTFEGNSKVTFANYKYNYGGMLSIDKSEVIFKGNATVNFYDNVSPYEESRAMYVQYSTVIFKENCNVTFDNNTKEGALYIQKSSIRFEETSTVTFKNNKAATGGGMYITESSHIKFKGNSTVTFDSNEVATNHGTGDGGAVYIENNCTVLFEENSVVTFTNNKAHRYGGAVHIVYAVVTFTDNSNITFNNNSARSGGAVYSSLVICKHIIPIMWFAGNSTILFDNNKSYVKGGAVCIDGTEPTFKKGCYPLKFDKFSNVTFTNNEAFNGGAVYVGYSINMISREYSTLTFRDNLAYIGGAVYSYASIITFQGNSRAMFNNNSALQDGGALFCYIQCNISFAENFSATFTHNKAMQVGGVVYIQFRSVIRFKGNSTIIFTENKAIEYGGVIHSSDNSLVALSDYTNILFYGNTARNGGAVNLFMSSITGTIKSNVTFQKSSAEMGGAIYISGSNITFTENSFIQFIKNTALRNGGAIYLGQHSNFILTNNKTNFFDNSASDNGKVLYVQLNESMLNFNITKLHFSDSNFGITRKMIYISVPKSCNRSCLLVRVAKFPKNIVSTSPRKLMLYDPAKCIDRNSSDCNTYYISNIMLGQEIRLNACVWDYYNQPTELTDFLVNGIGQPHYNVSGSKYISVSCNHTTQGVSIIGKLLNTSLNYSINISMYTVKTTESKSISVKLIVELSQCHPGFQYVSEARKCECYNTKNIVSCSGSNSTIKRGYWFGKVNGKATITTCPNEYCNFTCCEITNGIYHLYPVRANQCKSHRSGTVCGDCENGYTLSFDSSECIEVGKCTIGQTVLVTALSFLYWTAVIVIVFTMMHFKVPIGSLYAIIYYYSVLDIFLKQASLFSNGLYTVISIMSSLAKLTPQFLGQLCLVRNMSGIDQQFIHYVHPIVVSLILVMLSMLARRSRKVSLFISRGIIHFICFLLLLSYTSVTTTSLLLMRSLTFVDIDKVYTYLSPGIEYFHGRHITYVIVAVMFTILVVISLPLLLLLEPFLNSKINFIKIKPLLDQFQGGYKDRYRYFAAYYLICRIVIVVLVMVRSTDDLTTHYILITACAVITLIHLIVRPYADKIDNIFDGIILQLMVVMSVLPIIQFVENYNETLVAVVAYLCTILPLVTFIAIKLWINKNKVQDIVKSLSTRYLHKYHTVPTEDMEIPPINDTTDNCVRRNTTVVNINHTEEHLPDLMWCREPFLEELNKIEALNDIVN